jgi:hypothetical protein
MKFRLSSSASAIVFGIALAVAPAVCSSSANATTITTATQTVTFGPGLTDFSNASQSLNLFDSSLGTLDSVIISGTYGFNSTLTVSATGPSSGSVRTESASAFGASTSSINAAIQALLDTAGPAIVGGVTLSPAAFDLLGSPQAYSLASAGSVNVFSNATVHTTGTLTDTTPADLTAFEAVGGGLFNVLFNTITGTVVSTSAGNTSASQATTATGTVSIAYTYDTAAPPPPTGTPEPASLALMGTGVLGIAAVLRRRRKV